METETSININSIVPNATRTCSCCGKSLTISHFKSYKDNRYSRVCNDCKREKNGGSAKFEQFTTRELMDELKARGWNGKLRHIRIEEMSI